MPPTSALGDLGFLSFAGQVHSQDPLLNRYDEAAQIIPKTIAADNLDEVVRSLPSEVPATLTRVEVERLKMAAAFLAQAYVWAGPQPDAPRKRVVPQALAAVLVKSAEMLNEPPMFNYADNILRNWAPRIGRARPFSLNDLDVIYVFTDLSDERNFNLVHVLFELEGAKALESARLAINAARSDTERALHHFLELAASIRQMRIVFESVTSVVSPRLFRDPIRQFLMGWRNNVTVEYEGQHIDTELRGETGAQSSTVPLLDMLLGISAKLMNADSDHGATYADWINYMPADARLRMGTTEPSGLVDASRQLGADGTVLLKACIEGMRELRSRHLDIASRYISKTGNPVGTGGSDFRAYLSYTVEHTVPAPEVAQDE